MLGDGANGVAQCDQWKRSLVVFTSVMMLGSGVTGNRVIGGFDAGYQGQRIDLMTGEHSDSGQVLSIESVGAGLLALAGLDPAEHVLDASPLMGMMS